MARILCVGIATLDLIFRVDHYPREDEEMRANSLRITRGGNAANTAVVLAALGHKASFAGVLAEGGESALIVDDLARQGVDWSCSIRRPGRPPTSSILLAPSGSRTIVHYRDLPEFSARDFAAIDLAGFDWVHFEGRNVPELPPMMARVREAGVRLSLEVEKPRPGVEMLLDFPDVLLTGRALARAWDHLDPETFLTALRSRAPRPLIFLGWGEAGAWALEGSRIHHTPAFPPPVVVDTVGAGDTFNAGVIHGLLTGADVATTLREAARLAGRKCGREGFSF